jgi:hypothetical protein
MAAPAPTHVVTFVYFDYQRADPRPTRMLSVSFLRQVVRQLWPDIPIACKQWLKKATRSHKIDPADLEETFLSLLPHVQKCYIVVDALDESGSPSERTELLTLLTKLAASKSVRLFITSRLGIADIQSALEGTQEVKVEADKVDSKVCLSTMIDRSDSRQWIKPCGRDSTVDKIIERSHGMSVPLNRSLCPEHLTQSIHFQVPLARAATQTIAQRAQLGFDEEEPAELASRLA